MPELFVSSAAIRGNAGGDYYVFRKGGNGYHYLGCLFLHPKAFRVLPMESDKQPKMILYWRSGCCEGTLVTVKHTGTEFVILERETIYPNDRDRERYRQIFGY